MKQGKKSKLIIIALIVFYVLILISLVNYIFINKGKEPGFTFDDCIERYSFVYRDECSNESFYLTYPENKTITGKLPKINFTEDSWDNNIQNQRCIYSLKFGCGEYNGKI